MNDLTEILPQVAVVVPVRNEEGNVAALVSEIEAALAPLGPFEIIYVNDGSTDRTGAVLNELMETRPHLRRIDHAQSCGQSAAVRTGVRAARAPVCVTIDGDGQNDPAFIPQLVATLAAAGPGCGLVQGQRTGRKTTGFKKFQSRTANIVRARILKDGTRDTGCGLKAFRRDAFLDLPYFETMHRFLPALFIADGWVIDHVDVVDRPRGHGTSKYGNLERLLIGIPDLFGVAWIRRRRRRNPMALARKDGNLPKG